MKRRVSEPEIRSVPCGDGSVYLINEEKWQEYLAGKIDHKEFAKYCAVIRNVAVDPPDVGGGDLTGGPVDPE